MTSSGTVTKNKNMTKISDQNRHSSWQQSFLDPTVPSCICRQGWQNARKIDVPRTDAICHRPYDELEVLESNVVGNENGVLNKVLIDHVNKAVRRHDKAADGKDVQSGLTDRALKKYSNRWIPRPNGRLIAYRSNHSTRLSVIWWKETGRIKLSDCMHLLLRTMEGNHPGIIRINSTIRTEMGRGRGIKLTRKQANRRTSLCCHTKEQRERRRKKRRNTQIYSNDG